MGRAVAIGAASDIAGFALAGVQLRPVSTDSEARVAWSDLGPETTLAILTRVVAAALDAHEDLPHAESPLRVVMPS